MCRFLEHFYALPYHDHKCFSDAKCTYYIRRSAQGRKVNVGIYTYYTLLNKKDFTQL